MKHSIYIVAISTLILASCGGNNETKTAQTDTPPPPSMPTTAQTEPSTVSKAPDEITLSRKDTGKTDKIIFLVKNIAEPTIDRSSYSVTKPEDNEKYIAVQVWVKNVSSEEIKVFEEDFKLFDQDDAEFAEKKSFTEHRRSPILFDEEPTGVTLKPNQAKSGWITFTTDIKSKANKITYSNITVKL